MDYSKVSLWKVEKKKDIRILLVPKWQQARKLKVAATVEAEYGDFVLEGDVTTLAHHHPKYKDYPAPCNSPNVPILKEGDIVISHIDLDTIGGIMALLNIKPKDDEFWKSVEYIDVNGPHTINNISHKCKLMIQGYWAWCYSGPYNPKTEKIRNVTEVVYEHIKTVSRIIDNDMSLIEKGKKWAEEVKQKTESCLFYEDELMRGFITPNVFCSSSYFSETQNKNLSITVVFHWKKKEIKIATSDGSIDCAEVVKILWGSEAGGKEGIACSPRGKEMSQKDFYDVINYIKYIKNAKVA